MANIQEALEKLAGDKHSKAAGGTRFERFAAKVFQEHPGAYGRERFEDVWLWSEWPDKDISCLPEKNGIDLVAKQTEAWGGGLCAIQVKWHTKSKIGKGDVAKFLVDANADKGLFTAGLFVSNTPLTGTAAESLITSTPRAQVLYTSVMDDWVDDWNDYVDDFSDLTIEAVPRLEERDYQTEAWETAKQKFSDPNITRGQIILPCGTGKMFVALRVAEEQVGAGGRVLYLVPSISLVHQTMQEWSEQRRVPIQYLPICSDPSVAKEEESDVDVAGYMAEINMPVTTNPQQIGEWLAKPCPQGAMQAVFSTYHSAPKIEQAIQQYASDFKFDLMILDEAHRTSGLGRTKEEGDLSPFRRPLFDKHIPSDKRIFFTATPRIFADKDRKEEELEDIEMPDCFDMADGNLYGEVFLERSFSKMIDGGWLSDYRVLVIAGSREAYLQSLGLGEGDLVWKDSDMPLDDIIRLAGAWDALASPMSKGIDEVAGIPTGALSKQQCFSAIAYLNRTKDSKWVAENWQDINEEIEDRQTTEIENWAEKPSAVKRLKLNVAHIEAKTPAADRVKEIQRLRKNAKHGECQVITNVGVFSEGVNVPSLNAVVFLDARSSAVDIAQQIGRVMRKSEGKNIGYVVIPILIPDDQDPDEYLKSTDFNKVWRVVKALRSHDDRLKDLLKHPKAWQENGPLRIRPMRHTGDSEKDPLRGTQGQLIWAELEKQIASKIVKVCGDRAAYQGWGHHTARIAANIAAKIRQLTKPGGECQSAFEKFADGLRKSVSEGITDEQAREMISQHVVTVPIFDAMLGKAEFAAHNPVSQEINRMLDEFASAGVSFEAEAQPLERAQKSMAEAFEGAVSSTERIEILREVYDGFFAEAMPDVVHELGIVYTPVELVDFIIRSTAAICDKEFGRPIGSENVHVLDPFTGTGTFLASLLEGKDAAGNWYIEDADIQRKYIRETHGNELVLLSYYAAALKIEDTMNQRGGMTAYQSFPGLCLTDTFADSTGQASFWGTSAAKLKQDTIPMYVVFGNPPWSGGKKKAGEGGGKNEHPHIAERISKTYVQKLKEITGGKAAWKGAGNLYVQAIRWASDRILAKGDDASVDHPSVIAFVHPNSLYDGVSFAGMRGRLREEFSDIYVVNLRGDANKVGKEWKKEGDKIFGQGSKSGVQVSFFVRNPDKLTSDYCDVHYAEVPEYLKLKEKFAWLEELGDINNSRMFTQIPVVDSHAWSTWDDDGFNEMLAVVSTNKKDADVIADRNALGVTAAADDWVYSFSKETLEKKMKTLIERYQDALDDVKAGVNPSEAAKIHEINSVAKLEKALARKMEILYDPERIRECLYRPFNKLFLYEDSRILSSVNTISEMFPRDGEAEAIEVTGGSNNGNSDSVVAVGMIGDYNSIGPARGGGVSSQENGDLDNSGYEHDIPVVRGEPADRSSSHQGVPANQSDPANVITHGGGGSFKQFSSQPPPTKRSSEFSQPRPSQIFAQREHSRRAELARDTADSTSQHEHLQHSGNRYDSGFAQHSSRAANKSDTENHSISRVILSCPSNRILVCFSHSYGNGILAGRPPDSTVRKRSCNSGTCAAAHSTTILRSFSEIRSRGLGGFTNTTVSS